MSIGLLDVNLLIALAWPSHVHHELAHHWFSDNQSAGWATCPMTQCAFVRISSNPRIIEDAETPMGAMDMLRKLTAVKGHRFWPDDLPFHGEAQATGLIVGHGQVADAYLLGLANHHKGKLVTLDRGLKALLPPGVGAGVLEIVGATRTP